MKKFIHPKVLQDLEFDRVLLQVAEKSFTGKTKQRILSLTPSVIPQQVYESLRLTDEYLRALESNNFFPPHEFETFGEELEKLSVENYFLSPETLLRIAHAVEIALAWKKFLKNFKTDFPLINDLFQKIDVNKEIAKQVRSKIARDGTVKDTASEELLQIRQQIKSTVTERNRIFNKILKKYDKLGYLDEIRESYLDDRPVLAVSAPYRKQVPGAFAGASRTGSIVFIEPEETRAYTSRLQRLHGDEQTEIIRILKSLSRFVAEHRKELSDLENFLLEMDFVRAKAVYAREINAIIPDLDYDKKLLLKQAYHPLLLTENRKQGLPTVAQDIELNENRRIMVISGPNAGGKSITLKTVGLLQLMFQSGIPVPVNEGSRMPFFEKILTDIGDNQSIENQLSTYSYRLRNMRLFLGLADDKTLFLIDEFGTGSDPELGGALAEVFLEIFNEKKAYGVITTHYNNLKLLAEKLDGTFNAHMEFDLKTMSPTFKLHIGEPGSSHTFEVARKIGIPHALINRAKKKVDKKKVKFDQTLSDIQAKQKILREEKQKLQSQQEKLKQSISRLEEKEFQLIKKLNDFRELYETEKRKTEAGERILKLFKEFEEKRDKKRLWKTLEKWMAKEGIRLMQKTEPAQRKLQKTKTEIQKQLARENIREQLEQIQIRRMDYKPRVGDKVRVKGSKANATIVEITGNKAKLNYGRFTAEVSLNDLELVMRA